MAKAGIDDGRSAAKAGSAGTGVATIGEGSRAFAIEIGTGFCHDPTAKVDIAGAWCCFFVAIVIGTGFSHDPAAKAD